MTYSTKRYVVHFFEETQVRRETCILFEEIVTKINLLNVR